MRSRRLRKLWDQVRQEHNTPGQVGGAVGVGLFLGTLPLYGIHFPLCLAAAWVLKLNKITVYLAANISNPLVAPFLIAGGIALGETLRFGEVKPPDLDQAHGFIENLVLLSGELPSLFLSCLLGDALLGAAMGVVGGLTAWGVAWRWQRGDAESPDPGEDPG